MEDYDKAIVEAAERLADFAIGTGTVFGNDPANDVVSAVQAKRDAQRPLCSVVLCSNLAIQRFEQLGSEEPYFRCAVHKVTVTDL